MPMYSRTTRRGVLVTGTLTALSAAPVLGAVSARAATPTPVKPIEDDIGFLQFGAVAELLCIHLYKAAADHPGFSERQRGWLLQARAADKEHYSRLAVPLGGDGPSFGDYKLNFSAKDLKSRAGLLKLCNDIERLATGVYIAGAANAADPGTRELLARLTAADTDHMACLRRIGGRPPLTGSLPPAIQLEDAGPKLDSFISDLYPKA
jgi:hypothetical protein